MSFSDGDINESIQAREIAQEVVRFGVNQRQLQKIIYLLSLELEDRNLLETITDELRPLLFEETSKNTNSSIITE